VTRLAKENGMASVLIPLAPGFEDLEAVTLVDLLRRAGIEVVTAGLQRGLIQGSRGTRIEPDAYLDDVLTRDFDLIALPGGLPGAEHLRDDARVQNLLKQMAAAGRYTTAICAAPMALKPVCSPESGRQLIPACWLRCNWPTRVL